MLHGFLSVWMWKNRSADGWLVTEPDDNFRLVKR